MEDMTSLNNGGGATPPGRYSKVLGGIGLVKLLRYYGKNIKRFFFFSRKTILNCFARQRAQNDMNTSLHFKTENKIDKEANTNYNSNMMNYKSKTKTVSEAHSKYAFHATHSTYAKRAAFTLAEVLITLGIIGIVSAMTIPTLIAKYQEKVMVTKVKQGHSILMNAIQLYMVQNNCINASCLFDTKKTSEQVAAELGKVIKEAKLCKAGDDDKFCQRYYYKGNKPIKVDGVYGAGDSLLGTGRIYLPNGISFQFVQKSQCPSIVSNSVRDENGFVIDTVESVSEICAYIYMDVNNVEEPNQFGADMYRYNAFISGKVEPMNQKLLNNALIYNKLEYTPYNIGDPIEE